MIVLSLTVGGLTREVQATGARVVLGSSAPADVMETGAGWRAQEAVLVHAGTLVEVENPPHPNLRMRVGDTVVLGGARVALVGLLPLAAPDPALHGARSQADGWAPAPSGAQPAAEPTARTAEQGRVPVVFGGYEEGTRTGGPFRLVDESAPEPPRPPPVPRPAPASTPASPAPATARAAPGTRRSTPAAPPQGAGTPPPSAGAPGRPRPPASVLPTFGEELLAQIRRTPYFTISVAFHVLVFFVLTLVASLPPAGGPEGRDGTLLAHVFDPQEGQRADPQDPPEEDLPAPYFDEPPEVPLPLPPIERIEPKTPPPPDQLPPLSEPDAEPFTLGLNPSVTAANLRDPRRRSPPLPRVDASERFGKGEAPGMNRAAADHVRAALGLGTGHRGERLAALQDDALLVVEGTFDRIEDVLDLLHLRHKTVTPLSFTSPHAPDLSRQKVLFWNCGESLPPDRVPLAARRIRAFVEDGGYLFTTDWTVGNLLMLAFPGFVTTMGPVSPLPEAVIEIQAAPGVADDPILEGVFRPGIQGLWWLEQASFDVRVLDPRRVTVLIESPELERKFRRSTAVAVAFRHGKGRVLHVAGHYYQEMGNVAGTIAAQRLAMNFVLERLEKDPLRR